MKKQLTLTLLLSGLTLLSSCNKKEDINQDSQSTSSCKEWASKFSWDSIEDSYFELSPDGQTLLEWKDRSVQFLDMNKHPKLRQVRIIGGDEVFKDSSVQGLIIGDKVHTLSRYCFEESDYIQYLCLNKVEIIEEGAFDRLPKLQYLDLPSSLRELHENFIPRGDISLKAIRIADNHPSYKSVEGVLFNKAMTTLIKYPAGKEGNKYTVANGIKKIGARAFTYMTHLKEIILPESVTQVGAGSLDSREAPYEANEQYLRSVTIKAKQVISVALEQDSKRYDERLRIHSKTKIYVPQDLVEAYRNTPAWQSVAQQIEAIPAGN